jgi:hypothetical protein
MSSDPTIKPTPTLDGLLAWAQGETVPPEQEAAIRQDLNSPSSRILALLDQAPVVLARIEEVEPQALDRWRDAHPEGQQSSPNLSDAQWAAIEETGKLIEEGLRGKDQILSRRNRPGGPPTPGQRG